MPLTKSEVLTFLVSSDVRRILQLSAEFQFLLGDDSCLSSNELRSLLLSKIEARKPEKVEELGFSVSKYRFTRAKPNPKPELGIQHVFKSEEDKKQAEMLDAEKSELVKWWREFEGFQNKVRFGVECFPDGDLAEALEQSNRQSDEGAPRPDSISVQLQNIITEYYPRLEKFKTVPATIREKLLNELQRRGHHVSKDSLRSYLSRLDYAKSREDLS